MDATLPTPVQTYVTASNAGDGDAVVAAFAADAVVNDARREFVGPAEVRAWLDHEIIADRVTMTITRTRERDGLVILDAEMDGDYDKSSLPEPLVLTFYFALAGEHIAQLIIIHNDPTPDWARP